MEADFFHANYCKVLFSILFTFISLKKNPVKPYSDFLNFFCSYPQRVFNFFSIQLIILHLEILQIFQMLPKKYGQK